MRGRGLLAEKPPPSRSLPKRLRGGDAGGRGRFSERSASPPRPLSPEERLAFGLGRFCLLGSACELAGPLELVEVTAADRAAATMRRVGDWTTEKADGTRPSAFSVVGVWADGEEAVSYYRDSSAKREVFNAAKVAAALSAAVTLT